MGDHIGLDNSSLRISTDQTSFTFLKHTLDIVIMLRLERRGVAQFGLARLHGVQEAGGSNPLTPTSSKVITYGTISIVVK